MEDEGKKRNSEKNRLQETDLRDEMLLALKTEEGTTAKNCGWTLKAGKGKEMNFCWSFQKKNMAFTIS